MNSDIIQAKIARLKEDLRDLEASSIMLLREAPVEKMREFPSIYERETADSKSVFVRGFPPQTTAGELAQFFMERVGTVERSTIMMSRLTGASLGYAYIQFISPELSNKAMELSSGDRTFHVGVFNNVPVNVELMVIQKRTNLPGFRKPYTLVKPKKRILAPKKIEVSKVWKKKDRLSKRDPKTAQKMAKHLLKDESFDFNNIPRISLRNKTFNSGYRERISMKDSIEPLHETDDKKVKKENDDHSDYGGDHDEPMISKQVKREGDPI